jgi:hypothetical protein
MSSSPRNRRSERVVFGLLVLSAGVIFWLDQLGKVDAHQFWMWWPLGAIAMGIGHLFDRRWIGAAIWFVIGAYFLLPALGIGHLQFWRVIGVWPLLISVAGITLIVQALRPVSDSRSFHTIAVMAGNSPHIGSQRFRRGEAIAVMGGCEIDLSSAKIVDEAVIDVLAFWGGIEIRVPRGWNVVGHVAPILGGYEDKTSPAPENAPRLIIRGSAIMGGIEVAHPKESTA